MSADQRSGHLLPHKDASPPSPGFNNSIRSPAGTEPREPRLGKQNDTPLASVRSPKLDDHNPLALKADSLDAINEESKMVFKPSMAAASTENSFAAVDSAVATYEASERKKRDEALNTEFKRKAMELDRGFEIHTHLTLLEHLEPLLKKETFEAVAAELKMAYQQRYGNSQPVEVLDLSDDEEEDPLHDLFFEAKDENPEVKPSTKQDVSTQARGLKRKHDKGYDINDEELKRSGEDEDISMHTPKRALTAAKASSIASNPVYAPEHQSSSPGITVNARQDRASQNHVYVPSNSHRRPNRSRFEQMKKEAASRSRTGSDAHKIFSRPSPPKINSELSPLSKNPYLPSPRQGLNVNGTPVAAPAIKTSGAQTPHREASTQNRRNSSLSSSNTTPAFKGSSAMSPISTTRPRSPAVMTTAPPRRTSQAATIYNKSAQLPQASRSEARPSFSETKTKAPSVKVANISPASTAMNRRMQGSRDKNRVKSTSGLAKNRSASTSEMDETECDDIEAAKMAEMISMADEYLQGE